jgi:hypothetical protein
LRIVSVLPVVELQGAAETAHFFFFDDTSSRFNNGKLAQERNTFARKRNAMNFLFRDVFDFVLCPSARAMLRGVNPGVLPTMPADVSLDGAAT